MKNINNTITTPSNEYPTVQSAIDAAKSGNIIRILPGNYEEELYIVGKDNITLIASGYNIESLVSNYQVKFIGTGIGDTGLTIESNNVTVKGIRFTNYDTGVNLVGDNNTLDSINSIAVGRGFCVFGNNNKIMNCVGEKDPLAGLNLSGNYNIVSGCRFSFNKRGIMVYAGSFIGNIFFKNIVLNNEDTNIKVSTITADKNVFIDNTIGNSYTGLILSTGRAAIIGNTFMNHTNMGLIYKNSKGIILDNYFSNNSTGIFLDTCNSVVAGNIVQIGLGTGIVINGSYNNVVSNVVSSYESSGMIVNGCNNKVCSNDLVENKINLICNSNNNDTNCCYNYCPPIGCNTFSDLAEYLKIFNKPVSSFLK